MVLHAGWQGAQREETLPAYANGIAAMFQQFSGEGVKPRYVVGSRGTIMSRPSQLDLDVPVSVHPAPDILGFCLAFAFHMDVVMTTLMNNNEVVIFQV